MRTLTAPAVANFGAAGVSSQRCVWLIGRSAISAMAGAYRSFVDRTVSGARHVVVGDGLAALRLLMALQVAGAVRVGDAE